MTDQTPAGGRADADTPTPAGPPAAATQAARWAAARASWNAAKRRRRGHYTPARRDPGGQYRPGMSRKPPAEPEGDGAA